MKPNIEGCRIEAVRRMLYVPPNRPRWSPPRWRQRFVPPDHDEGGPIEFGLDDGRVFWLDAGADGEALKISWEAWRDPFVEPLSKENRRFVARSGKWTAFDVGDEPPYSTLVGATISDVRLRRTPDGKVTGIAIHTATALVSCVVEADEMYVDLA